jgi:glycosyltransferase involved in cell wall biosynthesis
MRVCYFGVYGPASPRNAMLIPGLRAAGVDVVECRAPLDLLPGHSRGPGVSGISIGRARYELGEARRMVLRVLWLTRAFLRVRGPVDAVVLAEYNQGLAPLAHALARLRGAALIVDFCLSLWDTAVNDRKTLGPRRPRAIYRKLLDRASLLLADRVLTETPATAEHFERHLAPVLEKNRVLQLGAPEWMFSPEPLPARNGGPLTVVYYGTWIPLHGVEFMVRAARLLADDDRFRFVLVGRGQTHDEVRSEYEADPSGNVEFLPYQPLEDLLSLLRRADICAGIFGTSPKARQVVSNKVWQCLAMGRPVVTGDGPGARSILRDGEHCLLVPHGDPEAIAAALRRLADDEELARRLSDGAARLVRDAFTSEGVGRQLADVVAEVARAR